MSQSKAAAGFAHAAGFASTEGFDSVTAGEASVPLCTPTGAMRNESTG